MSTATYNRYKALAAKPGGKWLFSRALCWRAPYFATIKPRVETLEPGRAVWTMRKRRAVLNHIGTVHALAMGNLCELAAGTLMECTVQRGQRWIPRGMEIEYLKKAESDLSAEATLAPEHHGQVGDLPVQVDVSDTAGNIVVRATIRMYVSEKSRSDR